MNWLEISDIPEGKPKDFEELQSEWQRTHFPLLWCVLEWHMKEIDNAEVKG